LITTVVGVPATGPKRRAISPVLSITTGKGRPRASA
jgi:hypothetical protein